MKMINVLARWEGQSEAARVEQVLARGSSYHGKVQYLSKTEQGLPYAAQHLAAEAFVNGEVEIAASVLRQRLPLALGLAETRERTIFNSGDTHVGLICNSLTAFVKLCERKEKETGRPVTIEANFY